MLKVGLIGCGHISETYFRSQNYFNNISFHHLEFYVGNAKQGCEYYKKIFGFSDYAYAGPETGIKDSVSYVIRKNKVFYVLTTPLLSKHPISNWLSKHGDGVYDIAFGVDSVENAYKGCLERGGESVGNPTSISDNNGSFSRASIKSYGDCIHSFINNNDYTIINTNSITFRCSYFSCSNTRNGSIYNYYNFCIRFNNWRNFCIFNYKKRR